MPISHKANSTLTSMCPKADGMLTLPWNWPLNDHAWHRLEMTASSTPDCTNLKSIETKYHENRETNLHSIILVHQNFSVCQILSSKSVHDLAKAKPRTRWLGWTIGKRRPLTVVIIGIGPTAFVIPSPSPDNYWWALQKSMSCSPTFWVLLRKAFVDLQPHYH